MNKILIKLLVLSLDEEYELFVLENKKLNDIKKIISDSISDIINEKFDDTDLNFFNYETGIIYNSDFTIKENGIINGTKLILL